MTVSSKGQKRSGADEVIRRRPKPFFQELGFHRASPWSESLAVRAAACRKRTPLEISGKFICLRVEFYGDDGQATGWAMEHLRRSFAHAWIEYVARGSPKPDVPELTWIAKNHHRHRMAQLQEDYRNILDGNTPVERFPDRHAHRFGSPPTWTTPQ